MGECENAGHNYFLRFTNSTQAHFKKKISFISTKMKLILITEQFYVSFVNRYQKYKNP